MKTTVIILGYKLNIDASMDETLIKRLNLCLNLLKTEKVDNIIVSGGCPNPPGLNISEAQVMAEYLIDNGVNPEIIIKEDKSLTTLENAKFSIPIVKELKSTKVIVITTLEHMGRPFFNPINLFANELKDNNVTLMFHTNSN